MWLAEAIMHACCEVQSCLTEQRAECEDGIPPESTIAFKSQTPLRHLLVKICINSLRQMTALSRLSSSATLQVARCTLQLCARNHPQKPAMKT